MKILVITSYYKPAYIYGGPTRSVSALCEALIKQGIQVTVFTTNANGTSRLDTPLGQPIDVDGVKVWYFPLFLNGFSYFFSPQLASAIRQHLTKEKYDLVSIQSVWGHDLIPTAFTCHRRNIPFIISPRGQFFSWALHQKAWKKTFYLSIIGKRFLNYATAFHCTVLDEIKAIKALGLQPSTFVIPNGIDISQFKKPIVNGSFRNQLGISKNAIILLFLGRLHNNKGPDIAIEGMRNMKSPDKEIHLILAGPDEQKLTQKLQGRAKELGCADRVHFIGLLKGDKIKQVIVDSDLFLMPSRVFENFGMAAVESMALGVPALVSDGIPIGKLIEKEGAGRVVSATASGFAQGISEMISKPRNLKEMGKRGQKLTKERFDISIVAQQMQAQYKSIIETGRPLPIEAFDN